MSDLNAVSTKRGRDAVASRHSRQLLRVDGITYTVDELSQEVGLPPNAIRARVSRMRHYHQPLTMKDFR